jgi:hypothetical protein
MSAGGRERHVQEDRRALLVVSEEDCEPCTIGLNAYCFYRSIGECWTCNAKYTSTMMTRAKVRMRFRGAPSSKIQGPNAELGCWNCWLPAPYCQHHKLNCADLT